MQMCDRQNKLSGLPSLKDAYADYFKMGVCINPAILSDCSYKALLCHEFNSITNENNLKPESIISRTDTLADLNKNRDHFQLDFASAIPELDFAAENHLIVRGHTLIWHLQTPDWIFYEDYDSNGALAGRNLMLKRMENYIRDVFTWVSDNYPNLFYAFDIANECIDDHGGLRNSLWRQTIGDDYLNCAFSYARKYAPEGILLFYNDYDIQLPFKQKDILKLLLPISEEGNLDGVGLQTHINTGVSPEEYMLAAKKYAEELNVILHITEMDVECPQGDSSEKEQGLYYKKFFDSLIDAKKQDIPIESVTVWGLTDGLSWKSNDQPLFFHSDLTPKDSFYAAIKAVYSE